MARKYSMDKRTASVDETRRRIVEATRQLHNERGILATSMQDIAARADVALGTVYRHFRGVDDLVPACGALNYEINPLPTPALFAGLDSGRERYARLVRELYAHYERGERPYSVGFAEAGSIPVLQHFMLQGQAYIASLVEQAIEPLHPDQDTTRLAVALGDFRTWQSLTGAGFTTGTAAALVAELLTSRLSSERGQG